MKKITFFSLWITLGVFIIPLLLGCSTTNENIKISSIRREIKDKLIIPFQENYKISLIKVKGDYSVILPKKENLNKSPEELYYGVDYVRPELWNLKPDNLEVKSHLKKYSLNKNVVSNQINELNQKTIFYLNEIMEESEKIKEKKISEFFQEIENKIFKTNNWNTKSREIENFISQNEFFVSIIIGKNLKYVYSLEQQTRWDANIYQISASVESEAIRGISEFLLNHIIPYSYFLHNLMNILNDLNF